LHSILCTCTWSLFTLWLSGSRKKVIKFFFLHIQSVLFFLYSSYTGMIFPYPDSHLECIIRIRNTTLVMKYRYGRKVRVCNQLWGSGLNLLRIWTQNFCLILIQM
jgi:hypothetical protein